MRNIIVIFLLALFASSQLGDFIVYTYQQHEAKETAREQLKKQLPDSALKIIIVEDNSNDIRWREDGKEFSLHDQMYDVAKIKIVNRKTWLYCLNDEKEEKVLDVYAKAIKSASDNSNNTNKTTYKFHQLDYFFNYTAHYITAIPAINSKHYPPYVASLSFIDKEVCAPPPKA